MEKRYVAKYVAGDILKANNPKMNWVILLTNVENKPPIYKAKDGTEFIPTGNLGPFYDFVDLTGECSDGSMISCRALDKIFHKVA